MGGGSGGSQGPQDSVTTFKPWGAQKPYLKDIYARASELSNIPQQYYPGATYADQDPATIEAQRMAEQRAMGGSDLLRGAQGYTQSVLGGDFLNSNPYLDQTYDRAASAVRRNFDLSVLPGLETRFARAGRLGGGAYEAGLGEATRGLAGELSGLATDIYGGNFQAERGRQEAASGRAQGLAEADYTDIGQLGDVGRAREARGQTVLDDLIARFNFGQQEPYARLADFSQLIGSPVGGSQQNFEHQGRQGQWYNDLLFSLIGTGGM